MAGIITGETNSFVNDGKSHWMMDEHGWWLRFADNTYPKGIVRDSGDISHSWEQINGKWWAFNETGYAKTGWLRMRITAAGSIWIWNTACRPAGCFSMEHGTI